MAQTLSWVNINNQAGFTLVSQSDIKSYDFVTNNIKDSYEVKGIDLEFDWDYYTDIKNWVGVYQQGKQIGYIQWGIVQEIWNGDE